MRRFFALLYALTASVALTWAAGDAAAITQRLVADGFENVRVATDGDRVQVVLEDNHYRGIWRGAAHALELISPEATASEQVDLIVLERRTPRLTVHATHTGTSWTVDAERGGEISAQLQQVTAQNPSAFKVDIVPYFTPVFTYDYPTAERIWNASFYLSPAIEMDLWPGSHLVAQAHIQLYNDIKAVADQTLQLGYLTLSQQILSNQRWDVRAVAGLFSAQRGGISAQAQYHISNNLSVGLFGGVTRGWSCIDGFGLEGNTELDLLAGVEYFHPASLLQFDVKAGRFYTGDLGVRADVLRHYRDYAVGVYFDATSDVQDFGFQLSIPVGSKRMGQHRAVRLRAPESYSLSFGQDVDYDGSYTSDSRVGLYHTAPDQNYSSRYWQPSLIAECIQLYLEGIIK